MRDFYIVIDLIIIVGLISLAVGSLVRRGYKSKTNVLFALFSFFTGAWIISNHLSNDTTIQLNLALFANYLVLASSLAVSILLMQFMISLAEVQKIRRLITISLPPLWVICLMCFSSLVVSDIKVQSNVYAIDFGPLVWIYALAIFYIIAIVVYCIIHGLKYTTGVRRRQLLSITFGLGLSLPLVVLFTLILPVFTGEFSLTEFGITPLIILVLSLYYGVVKYRLFDIKMAVVRTIVYVLSLATLSIVYVVVAYFLSTFLLNRSFEASISAINILLTLGLAFLFQPIRDFFDKITNKIFYRDSYVPSEFYALLSKTLTSTTDMRSLLSKVSKVIADTMKSSQVFFVVNLDNNHTVSSGTVGHHKIPKQDSDMFIGTKLQYGLIIASSLSQDDPVRRMMVSHQVELVLPLFREGSLVGYLCMGEHEASNYNTRDYKTIATMSDELVIAIQNIMSVQAVRELNSNLQQKIKDATKELRLSNNQLQKLDKAKDEFLSLASHQLRTPLTSVKGYLSMVLEGDVGKITKSQKRMLKEAFNSSERMVNLINDFLNVSRLQTGKFSIEKTPVNLSDVIEEELNSLKSSALSRGLTFIYKKPKDFPVLDIDESKIRQVIMNYADNAMYYSPEGSKIIIKLEQKPNNIIFTVKDSGIGVPKSEQEHLFTKFYRASNARRQRPDGTGVGLFLAKKIIDDHDGQLIFDSVEGKGSTFGFELPLQ